MTAAVVGLGAWAMWPVRDTSCVVYSGSYVPLDRSKAEADAAMRRAYDEALARGACGPERARFHTWTG